jgi:signal transduction histidine kinase/CheY-like chemotaxis protein
MDSHFVIKNPSSKLDFRTLFESAPGLFLVLTPGLEIVAVSDAYLRATMTVREQILGRGIFEIFPDNPDDPAATGVQNLRASLERVLQNRKADVMAVQRYDVRRPEDPTGPFEHRYWSPFNAPVLGSDGRVEFIIHRVEDVTEFVQLQQARQHWQEETAALQTHAAQVESEVYLRSQEVAESNRRLRAVNDQLGRLYQQISHLMRRADDELLATGQKGNLTADMGRQGSSASQDFSSAGDLSPSGDLSPEAMLARIERLITEHNQLEDRLRQSQKMEAVGQLAGGVAHDFNNLLTVITGHSVMLQQELSDSHATKQLKEIEAAAHRAATLTSQLLAFSRKQLVQPRVVSVNSVVVGIEELLRRLLGEHILVLAVTGSGLGPVKIDPTQLEMVIMNLAINARDAMPDGGRLTIETRGVTLAPGQVSSLKAGAYIAVSVADTGHGMDAATSSRVFEPFFTTKPPGKGTGLGLSAARGIVEQGGGTLTVQSKLGQGTTFHVYLPVAVAAAADKSEDLMTPKTDAPHEQASATVLVVEDHPPLRELISTVLSGAGFHVLEAANGTEALRLANNASVDVVLTDVVMPGMSGPALIQQLRARSPGLRAVIMSGHDQSLLKTYADSALFLQKPFTPKALKAIISAALETPRERHTAPSTGT